MAMSDAIWRFLDEDPRRRNKWLPFCCRAIHHSLWFFSAAALNAAIGVSPPPADLNTRSAPEIPTSALQSDYSTAAR